MDVKPTKMYAVVLTEQAEQLISPFAEPWLKKHNGVSFFNSPKINPDGPYFHLVLRQAFPGIPELDFELQLPHWAILGVFYSAELKQMGFA